MQGMVPGQMYPQQPMYVVADGTAAAGPIGVSSHPELYSKMMNMQQQQGFQAYANFLPQALPQAVQQPMLAPVPLSPERPTTMQIGPSSPATAVPSEVVTVNVTSSPLTGDSDSGSSTT